MIRLAHLSDIHFGGENVAAVRRAGEMLTEGPCDLVIVSGDLTQFAEIPEFEAAAAWLNTIPRPQLITPGNHDAPYLAWYERFFCPFRRYERTFGPHWVQTFQAPGLAVRGVNTARGVQPRMNWSKGQISAEQTAETTTWFAQAPNDAVRILVCHHPLMEMIGGPMTAKVWGGEAAAAAFSEAKIDLVLSGHIHAPFALPYPFGDKRTYAVGAGTLSVRERGVPPSFNLLEIDDQEIRIMAQHWTGSAFETARTWALDRRER